MSHTQTRERLSSSITMVTVSAQSTHSFRSVFPKCCSFTSTRLNLLLFSLIYLVFFFKLNHFLNLLNFKRELYISIVYGKTEF